MKQLRTRSSQNWNSIPGNFDCCNVSQLFWGDNDYGIPLLKKDIFVPKKLAPYGAEVRRYQKSAEGATIHFFLDDYKFEVLWNRPNKTLSVIQNYGYALSPDFSLFLDYPVAVQLWNTYRNRWLGRFWQENGIKVIPTAVWGEKESYSFAFCGIPKNSYVAIGTVGIKGRYAKKVFAEGFEELCKQVEPSGLILYGESEPVKFDDYAPTYRYDTYWKTRRKELSESGTRNIS